MSFIEKSLHTNFVWDAFDHSYLGRRKRRSSGFIDINCPMCVLQGEGADTRYRCGLKSDLGALGVNCFNCGFKARWSRGWMLSKKMKDFLAASGVPDVELALISSKAALLKRSFTAFGATPIVEPPSYYPEAALPDDAKSIDEWANEGCTDPDFIAVAEYLFSRGEAVAAWESYCWSPSPKDGMNRRLILPFTFGGKNVGYTARAIDSAIEPRYIGRKPPDFLFNNEVLVKRTRKYVVVVEGAFDALAIDGVALLGSTLTSKQAAWLRQSGQTVIVVPDRDEAGSKLIDAALKYGWRVAFPSVKGEKRWWEADVKDAAEAARRYGKLWTVLSLIESSTADPTVIAVKRSMCR
jgi:hypothetical protein